MQGETRSYEQLYREVSPSVVSIYTRPPDAGGPPRGAGSGFVYDSSHLVTNAHVVDGIDEVEVRFSENDWRTGDVVGVDEYTDLAAVRVPDLPEYANPLEVATESPVPGVRVAALGNPMGLDGTLTTGIVSGVNRSMRVGPSTTIPDTVQTDAAINPGNSGGPLVTVEGSVVGVNRARSGDNIGFAISPAITTRVVPDLVTKGHYRHSSLDIRTIDVSPTVAEANGLSTPRGVLVVDVSLGPASAALVGARKTKTVRGRAVPVGGDVIVGIGGRAIDSHEELLGYLMTETRPGEEIEIDLVRDGTRITERVTLGERPRPRSRSRPDTNRRRGRRGRGRRGPRGHGPSRGPGGRGTDIPVR